MNEITEEHFPFAIPKKWKWERLGNLAEIARGGSPRPIEAYLTSSEDGLNWIKISDADIGGKYIYRTSEKIIREGLHKTRYVKCGDFLLTNSMSFGRPYILKTNGCIHDGWLVLHFDKEKLDDEFLYYLLSSPMIFRQFNDIALGSIVKNLKTETVNKLLIPYPPLPKQKQIVSILDKVFAKIDEIKSTYQKQLEYLEEMYLSYQKSLISKESTSWIHTTIGKTCNLETGGTPSKTNTEYFKNGDINWLVSGDIHKKEIYECDGRITKAGLDNSNARYLPINSVLIALNGQGKTRGTVAMLRIKATCNQSLVSIYPNDASKLLPEYIFWNLDSRYTEIRKLTSDDGNDRRGLNMPIIRKIEISYPVDVDKQREIIENLQRFKNKVELLREAQLHKLTCVEELRKSILDKAFRGELIEPDMDTVVLT